VVHASLDRGFLDIGAWLDDLEVNCVDGVLGHVIRDRAIAWDC
jgi:hypothetical protein